MSNTRSRSSMSPALSLIPPPLQPFRQFLAAWSKNSCSRVENTRSSKAWGSGGLCRWRHGCDHLVSGPVQFSDHFRQWDIYLTQVGPRCSMRFVEDYPRNRAEFEARFSTEAACREYLVKLRWPDGFWCPRCGGRKSWPVRGVLLQCAGCGHQSSVTAGTIFQDTL